MTSKIKGNRYSFLVGTGIFALMLNLEFFTSKGMGFEIFGIIFLIVALSVTVLKLADAGYINFK